MRDRELQRLADSRRFGRDDWSRPDPEDEFAGLMNQRERQWIVNIQLSQLKCENPFLVIFIFLKIVHSRPLFLYVSLFCCFIVLLVDKILPMPPFEPRISGVGCNLSTN